MLGGYLCNEQQSKLFIEHYLSIKKSKNIVNIGRVNINNLRYADDTVLLAEGPVFLQALLTAVNEKGKLYGMKNEHNQNKINGDKQEKAFA